MKTLLTISQQDIEPSYIEREGVEYAERYATRAVLKDSLGRVALLYAAKRDYYKLPGGGVEQGEDMPKALARELLEEVGAQAKVISEIGSVEEWRDDAKTLHQISDAFLAEVNGEVGKPDFTEKEKADGFSVVWAQDVGRAIELVESALDNPDVEVRFMATRDSAILKAVV